MLPAPHNVPANVAEPGGLLHVPFNVPSDLGAPISLVGATAAPAMTGTPVPEATVDEHG